MFGILLRQTQDSKCPQFQVLFEEKYSQRTEIFPGLRNPYRASERSCTIPKLMACS